MSRKVLKGLTKSLHFKKRQIERKVTDREIIKAIEGKHPKDLKVIIDEKSSLLITVVPGDHPSKNPKLLTKKEGKVIKEGIKDNLESTPQDAVIESEWEKYLKEEKIKKIGP